MGASTFGEMHAASQFIMLVPIHQTTHHHPREDCNLNICYLGNLESPLLSTISFAEKVIKTVVHNARLFMVHKTLYLLINVWGSRWRYHEIIVLSACLLCYNFHILLHPMFEFCNFCQWSASLIHVIPNQHSPHWVATSVFDSLMFILPVHFYGMIYFCRPCSRVLGYP